MSQGAKQGTILALSFSAVITGVILLFWKHLMGIFTNTSELVELSMNMMCILAAGYIAMAVLQSLSGVMRGAGDTMTPMWISIVQTVCLRVPLAYLMCYMTRSTEYPNGRQECIFISLLTAWLLATAITCIFYMKGNWKNKAVTQV